MMSKTMRISVIIEDENGEALVTKTSERTIPYIEEIETKGFRSAFHDLETAILESRKEVSDGAVSEYVEIMSKKKTASESYAGETIEARTYGITCELGDVDTTSHVVMHKGASVYESADGFLERTASRERFKSNNFMELALDFATDCSNRAAAGRLNRIRHEAEGISPTTYRNTVEREGAAMHGHIGKKCDEALACGGFVWNGETYENAAFVPDAPRHIMQAEIENAAIELNIESYEAADYELPIDAVNVSMDEVGVKRQTEMRPKSEGKQQLKRVENTVLHIRHKNKSYTLNATSLASGVRMLMGFLLCGGLMGKQIVIFADGARTIHAAVLKTLHFANVKIILDWYHLHKRCKENLSMALNGSKARNEFLDVLMPCLWYGNVRRAIRLLECIDSKKVKNQDYIRILIDYFIRVHEHVPCYALRKKLGLRNSSNMGEKANDIIVSNRQKHNGMSWSDKGSASFASVSSASHNREIQNRIHNRQIRFELRAAA